MSHSMTHPPENICSFYIVRHGKTEWNTIDRIQGQLDSALTDEGISATKQLAEELKNIHFDALFSSDLSRAFKTAEILKLDRELAIVTHQALRERTFGKYDGSFSKNYTAAIRDLLEEYETLTQEEKWKFKFDEGYESNDELVSRFITKLREIAVGYKGKSVLVVTHGGNLRTFLTHLGYAKDGELTPGSFKNAGYVKVRSDGTDFFLDEVQGVDTSQGISTKIL